jgi:hypothetical protein
MLDFLILRSYHHLRRNMRRSPPSLFLSRPKFCQGESTRAEVLALTSQRDRPQTAPQLHKAYVEHVSSAVSKGTICSSSHHIVPVTIPPHQNRLSWCLARAFSHSLIVLELEGGSLMN